MRQSEKIKSKHAFIVGQFRVTPLTDGVVSVPLSAYQGNKDYQSIIKKTLAQRHIETVYGSVNVSLNAYLLQSDDKTILVDTGSGGALPPKGKNGLLMQSLAAMGVKPEDINDILITHMHPDHIGGLVGSSGKKNFPNATLHICDQEWDYWYNSDNKSKAPEFMRSWFDIAKDQTAPYAKNLDLFRSTGQMLFPSITTMPLPGHTPGHTGYLIAAKPVVEATSKPDALFGKPTSLVDQGSQQLFIWGDIVHVAMFEFAHPDWSMIFDINRPEASRQHRVAMNFASDHKTLIAGMHLDFPGVGKVIKLDSAYQFEPLSSNVEKHVTLSRL